MSKEEYHFQTVADVAKAYLCCSCGACQVVCPVNAVEFKETPGGYLFPVVDSDLCTLCGQCLRCCAGIKLTDNPDKVLPEDPFEGTVLDCRVGKATDAEVYKGSQSGGALSSVILSLLDSKQISGSTSVTLETGSPPRPSCRIVRTREEVLKSQGSKYCPAPVLSLISKIREEEGPVAFIGLGCHVHGLFNVMEQFPELRRKVGPVIGLVCDRVLTYGAIDYLLWRGKIGEKESVSLQYRSKELNGYPGDVRIGREGGDPVFLQKRERIQIKDYYTPARCRLCFDKMNVLSDLTFGDPHGIPDTDRQGGESLVIVRTSVGRDALDCAVKSGQMQLREASSENVFSGQAIEGKKAVFSAYCAHWVSLGRPLPAQAKTVQNKIQAQHQAREHGKDIDLALALDSFASRKAMVRSARKWLKKRKRVKKIRRIFGQFSLSRMP